jgi:ribose-phosphate pyrophosphokinase
VLEPEAKILHVHKVFYLAEKNCRKYGIPLGKVTMSKYSDGEFQPSYEESIRGLRVYCLFHFSKFRQSDGITMIDAAKRASARHITANTLFRLGKTR